MIARRSFLGDGHGCDTGGQLDIAAVGLELSEEQRNQARLAGAVRSYHTDLLPALDHQVRVIENLDAAAPKLDIVESNHRAAPRDRRAAPTAVRVGYIPGSNINRRVQSIDLQTVATNCTGTLSTSFAEGRSAGEELPRNWLVKKKGIDLNIPINQEVKQ